MTTMCDLVVPFPSPFPHKRGACHSAGAELGSKKLRLTRSHRGKRGYTVETYAHLVDVSRVLACLLRNGTGPRLQSRPRETLRPEWLRGEHGGTDVCVCAVCVSVSPPCVCCVSWVHDLVVVPVASQIERVTMPSGAT